MIFPELQGPLSFLEELVSLIHRRHPQIVPL